MNRQDYSSRSGQWKVETGFIGIKLLLKAKQGPVTLTVIFQGLAEDEQQERFHDWKCINVARNQYQNPINKQECQRFKTSTKPVCDKNYASNKH